MTALCGMTITWAVFFCRIVRFPVAKRMIGLLPISAFATSASAQAGEDKAATQDSEFLRIFHLDCGRKYFTVKEIEGIIDQLAKNHYTHIQLAFGNDGLRFLLKDMSVTVNGTKYDKEKVKSAVQSGNKAYYNAGDVNELTQSDMDEIIKHANDKGIQVIPMFNTPYHMNALLSAMEKLGMSNVRMSITTTDENGNKSTNNNYLKLVDNDTAVAFVKALQQKYMDYFKSKGCKYYNIATDEYAFDNISNDVYTKFAEYVNDLAKMVKERSMTPLAYNDGFYWKTRTSSVDFDTDIVICYWSNGGNRASAETLAGKHFKILNNTDDWYYVLGDYLYKAWGTDGQWGYADAMNGLSTTKVTQVKGDTNGKVVPIGSVLCCWCDGPSMGYNDNGYSGWNHPSAGQTNKESVYNLIKAMAENNPDYFKEYTAPQPELSVGTAQGVTVSAAKDGKYQVILPENGGGTVQLKLDNSTAENITWTSSDTNVATVHGTTGLVTFTGTTGTVTITATVPSAAGAESAAALLSNTNDNGTATYSVTFEVKAAGELPVEEITVQEGRTYDVTLKGNWVDAVKNLGNDYVQVDAVYNQTAEKELQAVTEIESGEQYLIVNQRLAQSKNENQLLTSGPATWTSNYHTYDVLSLTGVPSKESVTCWKITASNGGYTVQDTDGKYLNIGNNTASVGISSVLTLSYTTENGIDGATGGYWNISSNGSYYLNNLGNTAKAGGWKDNAAPTDAGSKRTFYRIVEKTAAGTTTVTFKGVKKGGPVDVPIGDTIYRITVTEKKNVEIPISIIDYRADGLLFDYNYLGDSYAYGFVHGKYSETMAEDTTFSTAYGYTVPGENYGTKITETTLERTRENGNPRWGKYDPLDNSWSRMGLVQEKLGDNGMPVYTEATVRYVAGLLAEGNVYNDVTSKENDSTVYSCNTELIDTFLKSGKVKGTPADKFSTAFANTRSYANITNAYDLAWYLLNNLYVADTNMTTVTGTDGKSYEVPIYGMAVDAYKSIVLTDGGNGKYTFEAGYESNKVEYPQNVNFDRDNGTISNGGDEKNLGFYPLEGLGYEQKDLLKNTSFTDGKHRNGSFTLRGESQFVYNKNANLYFTFIGDDDVYMYINGVLALDLGGAHGRNYKTVNLNKVAAKCGLVDGEVATFTFFYMERCSDASTFGIETNMELVQRDIAVEKNAYSDSQYTNKVNSGEAVSNGSTVYYDLVVSNQGNTDMTDISINDTDSFGGRALLGADQTVAAVTAGSKTEVGLVSLGEQGYTYYIVGKDGNKGEDVKCSSLDELSKAVATLSLEGGAQLHIRFLTAKVDVAQSKIISYTNTLKVTAVSGGKTLSDSAIHTIYSYNAGGTDKTFVVDFGLPLQISGIFDSGANEYIDANTGAIKLKEQPTYGNVTDFESKGMDTSMVYKLKTNTTINGRDTIKLSVPYKFGSTAATLDKNVYIIPASNVYYEDSLARFTPGSGAASGADWSIVDNGGNENATEKTDVYQALQQLGDKKIYGYDDAYNKDNSSKLSMGTAHKVTVTSAMLANWKTDDTTSAWPTASFTFTGTGFDVISLTDNTSGAILVKVTGAGADNKDFSKNYLVNNYYGYKRVENEDGSISWVVSDSNEPNALYQIPVMKVDVPYGAYNVTIQVFYNQIFDKTGNTQYNFWLDAIRVYNPMGENGNSYYTQDNEGYPQYIKLHDALADGTAKPDDKTDKMVFIDGGSTADIATYANYGPNNEVYLMKGQAITFKIPQNANVDSIQIGAKAPKGTANLNVNSAGIASSLSTATEMYYDITAQVRDGNYQVTITNNTTTTDNILSLTNLKITYKTKPAENEKVTLAALDTQEQENAVSLVRALFTAPVATFSPETFQADWGRAVRAGKRATLTVKTSADVESITVDGQSISSYTTRTQRTGWGWWSPKVTYHVFTYTITAPAQTTDYAVCAVNAEGTASEPITATLTVRPATWWNWWF